MTLPVQRHMFRRDRWVKKVISALSILRLQKFCCIFPLRHGAIVIAVTELTFTCLALFVLLLGATHAEDTVALVSSDLHNLEQIERNFEQLPPFLISNEKRMMVGQHFAFFVMVSLWGGLVVASIHLVSCIFLLYGAIKRSPNFLLPWTTTGFFGLVIGFLLFSLLCVLFIQESRFELVAFVVALYAGGLYTWCVVFSFYRELKNPQLKKVQQVFATKPEGEKAAPVTEVIQKVKC